MVHFERSIECYGCYDRFTTYPAMILHLESGSCGSGIDIHDLNESAARCDQWKAYLDEDYRDEFLNRDHEQSVQGDLIYPYRCSQCEVGFTKLSGMFQHTNSQTCSQSLHKGDMASLVNWLEEWHCIEEAA